MGNVFFCPKDGYLADVIPFSAGNELALFYLHDWREFRPSGIPPEGTAWRLLKTRDLFSFEEVGEAIPQGNRNTQDYYAFTGCVIRARDGYMIFYTGHNPYLTDTPKEAILRAWSADLIHWEKDESFYLAAPKGYEPDDFRDPFVWYDEETNSYNMLLAARIGKGKRDGITALAQSKDLDTWEFKEPIYSPNAYYTHECPDYFNLGGNQYLLFSEFTDRRVTQYRVYDGAWRFPVEGDGQLDGRAYYAAKTALLNGKRYAFGWVPTKEGCNDAAPWQWGGTLVAHELRKGTGNNLECHFPSILKSRFNQKILSVSEITIGKPGDLTIHSLLSALPESCLISADICVDEKTRETGFALRNDDCLDFRYTYTFDVYTGMLEFKPLPQKEWAYADFVGVSRKAPLIPGKTRHVDIVVDGDVCVLYSEGIALSSRMNQKAERGLGVISLDGSTAFKNVTVTTMEE